MVLEAKHTWSDAHDNDNDSNNYIEYDSDNDRGSDDDVNDTTGPQFTTDKYDKCFI